MLWYIVGVVLFALGIAVSIALHEFGHLLTAKAFGMKVTRYFIGFGPKLFSFRKGETEYGLKLIPAGGFCEIVGMTALEEVPKADAPRAFYAQKTWKRVIVLAAGSITHFIVGFLILLIAAVSTGLPTVKPVVGSLSCANARQDPKTLVDYTPCTPDVPAPAQAAGLRPNDLIVAVGGKNTATWQDAVDAIQHSRGKTPITIERAGTQQTLTVDVATVQRVSPDAKQGQDNPLHEAGAIGMKPANNLRYTVGQAFPQAVSFTGMMFSNTWEGLKKLPAKLPAVVKAIMGDKQDPDRPVSVVGASRIGGEAAQAGIWWLFLLLLASLNFFVGVFNLLPLLPLDGGHIAVNLYERVRDWLRKLRGRPAGAPVDYTRLLPLTYVVIFLGGAMVLLTVTADIVNPITLSGQ
ncbi:site-2 protease family protein [Solihabitans fulvus]|uniref:Site-2 protease family protein n=1 Tax=Solihabitans fulvus TaxID=1892852 RepID=A0A5B2X581_9PSEU|nr:site-2 protease family protein [Solihabitans fulvus]KAA2258528.1 site-2 protease family protein [Solihabitans fulvus]